VKAGAISSGGGSNHPYSHTSIQTDVAAGATNSHGAAGSDVSMGTASHDPRSNL